MGFMDDGAFEFDDKQIKNLAEKVDQAGDFKPLEQNYDTTKAREVQQKWGEHYVQNTAKSEQQAASAQVSKMKSLAQ